MIYRTGGKFLRKHGRRRVILDGIEIKQVYYIDRRRRVLRTFDTRGDGQPHLDATGLDVERKEIRWKRRQKLELQPIR